MIYSDEEIKSRGLKALQDSAGSLLDEIREEMNGAAAVAADNGYESTEQDVVNHIHETYQYQVEQALQSEGLNLEVHEVSLVLEAITEFIINGV